MTKDRIGRWTLALRAAAGAVVLCLGLAACQPGGAGGAALSFLPAPAPQPVTLRGGAVRVVGPPHYCPDTASLRETQTSAVVLLGRCAADLKVPPAILSVAVGAPGSGAVLSGGGAALATFMTSDAGRASISRSGRAKDVTIASALMAGPVFLMRIRDRAEGDYWRGMIPVAGALVSISAIGPGLAPEESRRLVEAAARAMIRANRG